MEVAGSAEDRTIADLAEAVSSKQVAYSEALNELMLRQGTKADQFVLDRRSVVVVDELGLLGTRQGL